MNIEYMKFGNSPRTMILLPGLNLQPLSEMPRDFRNLYDIFADDYTAYIFEYRESPKEGLKLEDMADDAAQAIQELGLKDIYLCGVSLGGMVAQWLVLKYPQYFKKMVLCSTVSKINEDNRAFHWEDFARKKDIISLIDQYMKDVYTKEYYEKGIDVMISLYKDISDDNLKDLICYLESVRGFDVTDRLSQIQIPVKVFGSKKDKLFTLEQMKQTADLIGCESYFYEGYSHKVYDEAPDFKEKIYNFYKQ